MHPSPDDDISLRPATSDDYPAFCRLWPELQVPDPLPTAETWASAFVPGTWVAVRQAQVVAYCYAQALDDSVYVRSVVVGPDARRRGVGRRLMTATADQARAAGKTSWRLNVKPTNIAALALYDSLGLRQQYLSKTLNLPWAMLHRLPGARATVRHAPADRDALLEARFALPRGQLTLARRQDRALFEAISSDGATVLGLAVFNPRFPGAFPFRVTRPDVARDLLTAMREMVPNDLAVTVVAEDDEPLATLLLREGARLTFEVAHLSGAL